MHLKAPPSNFEDFYNKILQRNQPVVIENAGHIFGHKVQQWTNLIAFLRRYGQLPVTASLFDTKDIRTRFGVTPFLDEKDKTRNNLLSPYHQIVTLQELFEFNTTNRLLFAEQFSIYHVHSAKRIEGEEEEEEAEEGEEEEEEEGDVIHHYDEQGAPIAFDDSNSHISKNKLYQDWKKPIFMPNLRPEEINLWVGRLKMWNNKNNTTTEQPPTTAAGKQDSTDRRGHQKVSPLHQDPYDNLMLQLLGTKTFYMYHAFDAGNLHPEVMKVYTPNHPNTAPHDAHAQSSHRQPPKATTTQDNFSPVDPLKINVKRFPHAKHATRITCRVRAGEALYMPSFTWHNVVSEGEEANQDKWQHGMNMGINVWSMGDRRFQLLFETVMHWLQNGEEEEDVLEAEAERKEEL
jgi:hypothetical protein